MKNRKGPVHFPPIEKDDRPTVVMVTTCVKNRRELLAADDIHVLLRDVWTSAHHWQINRYVLMPDHIHLFCCPAQRDVSLCDWMQFWRSWATRRWPRAEEKPLWQKDFWDTQIRSGIHFTEKWHYVRNNPVRKALVARPEDWPFQGELFPFAWIER